jgi:hypothetical protein
MEVKSLFWVTTFFVQAEKRPKEALCGWYKKVVAGKSLKRTAGLGSSKIKK